MCYCNTLHVYAALIKFTILFKTSGLVFAVFWIREILLRIWILVVNNDGSGTRRPKNFRIEIHNTGFADCSLTGGLQRLFLAGASKLVAAFLKDKKAIYKQVFCSSMPFDSTSHYLLLDVDVLLFQPRKDVTSLCFLYRQSG
jgi:hypothetical protein